MRAAILVLFVVCAVPHAVTAQCVLSGEADIDAVTPRGTTLRFGLAEEARITLDGTRARVEGIAPIAFEGRARTRDVQLFTSAEQTVGGVVTIEAGTALRVNRVAGQRASSFIDAGPIRVGVSVPCGDLALVEPPAAESADTAPSASDDFDHTLLVRGRALQVFSGATGQRGLRLTLRAGSLVSDWPWLEARGVVGSRIHIHAVLAEGVTVEGWVHEDEVHRPDAFVGHSCCDAGTMGGCGHGYAGQTYRGTARLTAGAELRDSNGRGWGRVVADSEATVVVTHFPVMTHLLTAAQRAASEDIVWVEAIPGVVPDACSALGVQVDRASVVLPTETR